VPTLKPGPWPLRRVNIRRARQPDIRRITPIIRLHRRHRSVGCLRADIPIMSRWGPGPQACASARRALSLGRPGGRYRRRITGLPSGATGGPAPQRRAAPAEGRGQLAPGSRRSVARECGARHMVLGGMYRRSRHNMGQPTLWPSGSWRASEASVEVRSSSPGPEPAPGPGRVPRRREGVIERHSRPDPPPSPSGPLRALGVRPDS
jgi:hypothetical protein